MTMKRNKGLTSLDLIMPVPSNHRTDQQLSNDIETNTDNHKINDISQIATTTITTLRPKGEIFRTNSPTFKRLVSVRIKLEKHINSIANNISVSQQSTHEPVNIEKPSTANVRIASSSQKRIKSKPNSGTGPLDKITYEKTWSHNGNVKQKCSLEIWLPKAGSDDEDGNTSRPTSPNPDIITNKSQSPQTIFTKSRRSSTMKLPGTTTSNSETKSLDDVPSKKSDSQVIPRVYHYEEYLSDQPEERPRSGKSGNTNKTDGNVTNKNTKRQHTRSHARRQSPTTNKTEETVQSTSSVLPMTSKNLIANIKQTYSGHEAKGTSGSSNSSMINELMRKYSLIKKSHQELTQPRLQLEKPHQDSKNNAHITKDHSLPSPPSSDTAISYTSSDHPIVSVRKLFKDASPPQTADNHNNSNTKLNERRSSNSKPSYLEIYPQTRLFSLVNHLQHRQTSASMPNAILPAVVGRKNEDPFRSFHRSKTLDVVFAVPVDHSNKIPSRLPARIDSLESIPHSSNQLQRTTNANEQVPSRLPKRSLPPPSHTLHSEQQQTSQPLVQLVQYQNIQSSAQRYHRSTHSSSSSATDVSTNKVLVHLKYSNGGNTDRKCLIPE